MKKGLLIALAIMFVLPLAASADTSDASLLARLHLGSRGAGVTRLQTLLASDSSIYPEGLVTGIYGPLTQKAVVRLQQKNSLVPVGYVGPKTLAVLLQLAATPVPVVPPVTTPTPAPTTTPVIPPVIVPAPLPTTTPVVPPPPVSTDTTPPSMSYITVSGLTDNIISTAVISWATNEPATSKVYISTSTPLMVDSATSFASATLTTSHTINLSGLLAHTQYYYVLESIDAAGNVTHSSQNYFSTTY